MVMLPLKRILRFPDSLLPVVFVFASVVMAQESIDSPTALLEHRKQLDDTVWKLEVKANKYESSLTKFWDDLRTSEDPVEFLKELPFGKLEKPNLKLGRKFPERILEFVHKPETPARRFMKLYEKESLLNRLKVDGFSIDQSEWRHISFNAPDNGRVESVIEFSLHINGPRNTLYRRILTGSLRVLWKDEPEGEGEEEYYYPDEVTFSDLRMLRRSGVLSFKETEWLVSDTRRKPYNKVIVEDIDADGLPDVLFPLENRVYFNQGDFRFNSKPFVSRLTKDRPTVGLISDLDLNGTLEYTTALSNGSLAVYEINPASGLCEKKPKILWKSREAVGIQSISAGDITGDGYPELFLGQYKAPYLNGNVPAPYYDANDGFPSFLLKRNSSGSYTDISKTFTSPHKRNRRVSASAILDLNEDDRMDLLVTSDYAGIDLYFSGENRELIDRSSENLDERRLFGSSLAFGDFNRDGMLDFFATGTSSATPRRLDSLGLGREAFPEMNAFRKTMSHGNRLYHAMGGGLFEQPPFATSLARTGRSSASAAFDFNNDGFPELYVSNGYVSRESARDYGQYFWRHDIYDGVSVKPKVLSSYLSLAGPRVLMSGGKVGWHSFQNNAFFLNVNGTDFLNVAYLLGVSHGGDGRAVVQEDFNGDGLSDILLIVNDAQDAKERVFLYENRHSTAGNWIGVDLKPNRGASAIGAKVRVTAEGFASEGVYVLGQAYSAQGSSRLHFGLGEISSGLRLEVDWPSGQTTILDDPSVNQYHSAPAK